MTDDKPAFPQHSVNPISGGNSVKGGLTARQYAAIHLCVPRSGDEWLDDMIRDAQRDRFAMAALGGLLGNAKVRGPDEDVAKASRAFAAAIMQERE